MSFVLYYIYSCNLILYLFKFIGKSFKFNIYLFVFNILLWHIFSVSCIYFFLYFYTIFWQITKWRTDIWEISFLEVFTTVDTKLAKKWYWNNILSYYSKGLLFVRKNLILSPNKMLTKWTKTWKMNKKNCFHYLLSFKLFLSRC